jgi:hypothetical protein
MRGISRRSTGVVMTLALGLGVLVPSISILNGQKYRERLPVIFEPLAKVAVRPTGEITGSMSFSQTFRATRANLAEIEVFLSNYGQPNQAPLLLSVTDLTSGNLRRSSVASPRTVADNRYHSFPFAAIPNSEGRTYVVTLTSPQAEPGHAVTAWLNEEDPYTRGLAHLNGTPDQRFDLVLTLEYHSQIEGVLNELVNRTSQYKPRFFKGARLIVLAFLALIIVLLAANAVTMSIFTLEDRRASP